jgi:hypothetical protein
MTNTPIDSLFVGSIAHTHTSLFTYAQAVLLFCEVGHDWLQDAHVTITNPEYNILFIVGCPRSTNLCSSIVWSKYVCICETWLFCNSDNDICRDFVLLHLKSNNACSCLYQSGLLKQSFVGNTHIHYNYGRDIYGGHSSHILHLRDIWNEQQKLDRRLDWPAIYRWLV